MAVKAGLDDARLAQHAQVLREAAAVEAQRYPLRAVDADERAGLALAAAHLVAERGPRGTREARRHLVDVGEAGHLGPAVGVARRRESVSWRRVVRSLLSSDIGTGTGNSNNEHHLAAVTAGRRQQKEEWKARKQNSRGVRMRGFTRIVRGVSCVYEGWGKAGETVPHGTTGGPTERGTRIHSHPLLDKKRGGELRIRAPVASHGLGVGVGKAGIKVWGEKQLQRARVSQTLHVCSSCCLQGRGQKQGATDEGVRVTAGGAFERSLVRTRVGVGRIEASGSSSLARVGSTAPCLGCREESVYIIEVERLEHSTHLRLCTGDLLRVCPAHGRCVYGVTGSPGSCRPPLRSGSAGWGTLHFSTSLKQG